MTVEVTWLSFTPANIKALILYWVKVIFSKYSRFWLEQHSLVHDSCLILHLSVLRPGAHFPGSYIIDSDFTAVLVNVQTGSSLHFLFETWKEVLFSWKQDSNERQSSSQSLQKLQLLKLWLVRRFFQICKAAVPLLIITLNVIWFPPML